MSRALTSRGRWLSKLALGTKPLSRSGRADLQHGSVESLPLEDNSFDKARAINSMQVSPDAVAGLREIRRVMKPGAAGSLLPLRPIQGSRTRDWRKHSSPLALRRRTLWKQGRGSGRWRQNSNGARGRRNPAMTRNTAMAFVRPTRRRSNAHSNRLWWRRPPPSRGRRSGNRK
jgi:SAM-dependent methyltransferase